MNLDSIITELAKQLVNGEKVKVPQWQGLDVIDKPQEQTIEITDLSIKTFVPITIKELQEQAKPNLPWAENHFQERVSGKPLNPGETYKEWPWYQGNVEKHKEGGQFSHTYMERYWPKSAGEDWPLAHIDTGFPRTGIRFKYGDLNDVVNLLAREPKTRQAYLPMWFPEDTGAVHKQRVPCSLGYLFLMRDGKLNIIYYIRSCDFYRHFRDDVYLTARLCQWVLEQLSSRIELNIGGNKGTDWCDWREIIPGTLTMHIGSLHVFEGDLPRLRREYG